MSAARLLCVAHDFPVPADNGSSARVLGFLRLLGEVAPVRLVVRPRATTTAADVEEVAALPGIELVPVAGSFRPRFDRSTLWPRAVVRRAPPWFVAWYDGEIEATARRQLGWATHLVAMDDFAAQYLPALRHDGAGASFVADKHMIYASPDAWGPRPRGALAPARTALLRRLATANERRVLASADRVVVTSPEEADRLRRLHGRAADGVVPTAVEPPATAWHPPPPPAPVLYLGNLTHGPNRHGLVAVLRAIRDRGSRFPLLVVGKGVDDELRAEADGLDVTFAGFVDDLAAAARAAGAAIVPLWSGAGVRVKLLDLLATGIPVVVTPAALEAVGALPDVHCRVAATPGELVDAVAAMLDSPAAAAALGRAGRALVVDQHTWPRRLELLVAALGLGDVHAAA